MGARGEENFNLDAYFDRRELQRKKEAEADEQMRKLTRGIQDMGQKLDKVTKKIDGTRERTLADFTLQEMWDAIKVSPKGIADMQEIFSDRFSSDPEFRKQALDKLSKEDFTEDVKSKKLDGKLDALCADEACRAELEKMIREAKRKK